LLIRQRNVILLWLRVEMRNIVYSLNLKIKETDVNQNLVGSALGILMDVT